MEKSKKACLLEINIATVLLSLNFVIVKLISLPAEAIVLLRTVLAAVALCVFLFFIKERFKLASKKDYFLVFFLGFLLAVHWITLFYAIKISTVAIAVISLFTYPVITTFLEPYFDREKTKFMDVFMAILVLAGVFFMMPSFDLNDTATLGVLFGLTSGFTYSLRNVITKRYVKRYSSSLIMFYQILVTMIVTLPFLFVFPDTLVFKGYDVQYLLWIGLIGTALAHTLFIKSFASLKVRTASMISLVQPVYGIFFAYLLLNEVPTLRILFGGLIVLGAVAFDSYKHVRERG